MICTNDIEAVKSILQAQLATYEKGVLYVLVEDNIITWNTASKNMALKNFQEGNSLAFNIEKAIKEKQVQTVTEYEEELGKNIDITIMPVIDDANESTSAFLTVIPKIHPLQDAFSCIAPIITDLFPEGAFISLTDTKEIIQVQRSEKYDIPVVEPGFDITQQKEIMDVISSGKKLQYDDDSLTYGPPVRVCIQPYYDSLTNDAMGVVNIIRPKRAELSLREMSQNLERQLSEVSRTIQELAEASTLIHENEMEMNQEIEEINEMANQIFEVSKIIESIAGSTKMLGLNASIEAARAGSVGRGFGVVAGEINKLSDQSKNTVPVIKKLTDAIKAQVEESKTKSHHSLSSSQEQVAATEEITATIEEIQAVSVELANIANSI